MKAHDTCLKNAILGFQGTHANNTNRTPSTTSEQQSLTTVRARARGAEPGGLIDAAVAKLAEALAESASGGKRPAEAWEEHWDKAYTCARLAVNNIVSRRVGGPEKWSNAGWRSTPASRL